MQITMMSTLMADLPSALVTDACPGCGTQLEFCVGYYQEEDYEAVRCPQGCDLYAYYT